MGWIFVSLPKFIRWNSNSQCDGVWSWGHWEIIRCRWGYEGGALHDGISALIRRGRHRNLSPHMWKEEVLWAHSEMVAICKPKHGPTPGTQSAGTLTLEFPDPKTVRIKYLLFKPPSLWYFVIAACAKTGSKFYLLLASVVNLMEWLPVEIPNQTPSSSYILVL